MCQEGCQKESLAVSQRLGGVGQSRETIQIRKPAQQWEQRVADELIGLSVGLRQVILGQIPFRWGRMKKSVISTLGVNMTVWIAGTEAWEVIDQETGGRDATAKCPDESFACAAGLVHFTSKAWPILDLIVTSDIFDWSDYPIYPQQIAQTSFAMVLYVSAVNRLPVMTQWLICENTSFGWKPAQNTAMIVGDLLEYCILWHRTSLIVAVHVHMFLSLNDLTAWIRIVV